jgi:hypothetical protein
MRVLVACEFSGIVRDAFIKKGHDAWSCDLLPSDSPESHYQGDVLEILGDGWDLLISHPPCTYLCSGGFNWLNRRPEWRPNRELAVKFFMELINAPIDRIVVENPIGHMNTRYRKPDQIVRPWMFGHGYRKDICLWLKNLPLLKPTNIVEGRKLLDFWSDKRVVDGRSLKSITFQGVADAMVEQWGNQEIYHYQELLE